MDEIDPVSQRFQAATTALKELNHWLEEPSPAPICVAERCKALGISFPRYHHEWKTRLFPDPWRGVEMQALEDWAIRQVQPNWKRKET